MPTPASGLPDTLQAFAREFLKHAGRNAWLLLGMIFALGLIQGAGIGLLVPLLQAAGITDGSAASSPAARLSGAVPDQWRLPAALAAFVLLGALHALATRRQEIATSEVVQSFIKAQRDQLYTAICRAPWANILVLRSAGALTLLATEISNLGHGAKLLIDVLACLLLLAVYSLAMLLLSPTLTLVALGCLGLLALAARPANRRSLTLGAKTVRGMHALLCAFSEQQDNMKLAKVYHREEEHARAFAELTGQVAGNMTAFARVQARTRSVHQIGSSVVLALVFGFAVGFADVPPTSLLVIVVIFARLLPIAVRCHSAWQTALNALPIYVEIQNLRRQLAALPRDEARDASPGVRPRRGMTLRDVSYRYPLAEDDTLRGIDLEIPARATTVLVGPSGGGKSTLVDVLLGLLPPTSGSLLVDGAPIDTRGPGPGLARVAYLSQNAPLAHRTIRENLAFSRPDADEAAMWEALEMAAAKEFVSRLPAGLDTVVGDRGQCLSGGERQRVALACALLREPELLVLDEATSNLDHEAEGVVAETLARLHGRVTIVIVTHRAAAIRTFDQIVTLEGGRIVGIRHGGPAEADGSAR